MTPVTCSSVTPRNPGLSGKTDGSSHLCFRSPPPPFPGGIRMGKVNLGLKILRRARMITEFTAMVIRDGVHPGFERLAPPDHGLADRRRFSLPHLRGSYTWRSVPPPSPGPPSGLCQSPYPSPNPQGVREPSPPKVVRQLRLDWRSGLVDYGSHSVSAAASGNTASDTHLRPLVYPHRYADRFIHD